MLEWIKSKKRLRNYGVWVALAALATDLLIYSGIISISEKESIVMFTQRSLEVLVLLGVISNPTKPDGKGFNL